MGSALTDDWLQQATSALRRGDFTDAWKRLEARAAVAPLDRQGQWLAAQICKRMGNPAGEAAALKAILADSPRDIAALLAMGQHFAGIGKDRAAMSWFTAAMRQAAVSTVPDALVPLLRQAETFCLDAQTRFADQLTAELDRQGITDKGQSPAIRYALDMLFGRAQLYLQQPSMFYYPGLTQRPFFDRSIFPWVAEMESRAGALRDEFLALDNDAHFEPYVTDSGERPAPNNPLLNDPAWGAAYLLNAGERNAALADRCPRTMAALAAAGQPVIPQRAPMALYSRLQPGAHIRPHHGLLNTRLICHLPLIAPDGCALRVGPETRPWRFGEMLIFDDSIEHEAWNRSDSDRVVLLFEIWRPDIGAQERETLSRLFAAIDTVDPTMGQEGAA